MKEHSLLKIEDLNISFRMFGGITEQDGLTVISNLSLEVKKGEIVAVAGASGSGKSLFAHAVMGLLPSNAAVSGTMLYNGRTLGYDEQLRLRGRQIALVPQSVTFLDPLMRIGRQIAQQKNAREKASKLLDTVAGMEKLYPFQLSGGMARRALVATAVMSNADLIIADEPTPGMDRDTALSALECFRELADSGKGVILITHDIDIAIGIADRLAVFYAGTTVETAPSSDFASGVNMLRHPYTKALWNALPQNGFAPVPGVQPYAGDLPAGCLFSPRCPYKTPECEAIVPPMRELRGGTVRCIYAA